MNISIDPIIQNFGENYFSHTSTVADSLIEIFKFFKIHRIYGISGDYAANLIKTLDPHFDLIPSSNEMHAAFSACAEAEVSGISASLVTYTVGSLPCLSAAALAKTENLPVIFISGAPSPHEAQFQSVHHMVHASRSWRKDENSALTAFSALGIRAERLLWPCNDDQPTIANQQLFDLISFAICMSEPVFIEIPRTLLEKKCQRINLPENINSVLKDRGELSGAALIAGEIQKRLKACQKPVLVFGERLKHNHELLDEAIRFCEKFQIPFASNLFAKGLVDESHPLSLGTYNGILSQANTRDYIENQADYLLEICTSILPQDTSTAFGTKTYKLHDFRNRTCLRGTATRCEDVLAVFKILNEMNIARQFEIPSRPIEGSSLADSTKIEFCNIASVLNQFQNHLKETLVYLPEVGNSFFSSFSLQTRAAELGRSWLTNPFYAAMGTSLPYAHAVCKKIKAEGYSDIPLVLTGDGGFHFQLNELINFQRADLFLIILYFKNNIFHLGKMSDSKIYQSSSEDFDPIQLVKAYGGQGRKVNTAGELREGIEHSIKHKKGIHFFEIPVSTDEDLQSPEVQIINTFIKAKSGVPESLIQWQNIGKIKL